MIATPPSNVVRAQACVRGLAVSDSVERLYQLASYSGESNQVVTLNFPLQEKPCSTPQTTK
jgi:hypothetical protein